MPATDQAAANGHIPDPDDAQPRPRRGAPSGPNRVGRGAAPQSTSFHPWFLFGVGALLFVIVGAVVFGLIAIAPHKASQADAVAALPPAPIQPTVSQDKDFYQKHDNAILVQRVGAQQPGTQANTTGAPRYGPDGRPLVDSSFAGPTGITSLASGPTSALGLSSPSPKPGSGVQPLPQASGAGQPLTYSQRPVETVTPVQHDPTADYNVSVQHQVPQVLPASANQQFPGQASLSSGPSTTSYGDSGHEGPTEIALGDGANAPVRNAAPQPVAQTPYDPTAGAGNAVSNGVSSASYDQGAAERRKHDILASQNETYDTPFVVQSGTFIPALLITGIDSELPGLVIAQVSQPVYDSYTHTQVLIPAKTRLIGAYKSAVALGGSRVLLGWDRLLYPNNTYRDLDGMEGAGRQGQSGTSGRVDTHRGKAFGSIGLFTLLSIGAGIATQNQSQVRYDVQGNPLPPTPAQQAEANAVAQLLGIGSADLQRQLGQPPTVHVDPGTRVYVIVDHDMTFGTPYHP